MFARYGIGLVQTHLPGVVNTETDKESRKQEMGTEGKLSNTCYKYIINQFPFLLTSPSNILSM